MYVKVVDEVKQKAHIQAVEKLRNETVEDFGQDFISNVDEDTYKLVSDQLKKQIKIMCIIITTPKYKQSRVIPQIETWVKRGCTDWVYASSKEDKSIKAIRSYRKDGYEFGYGKTRGGLIWSWKKYGDTFDYYLKADDDSYVVMENLRLFLMNKDPNTDVYEGFKLRISTDSEHPKPYSYHHGGAAYVMSKSVVRKLVEDSFPKRCQQSPSGADDRVIGKCLIDLKIHCPDTRDRLGGLLFMPSTPINFATKFPNAKFDIYSGYNWRKFQKGAKAYKLANDLLNKKVRIFCIIVTTPKYKQSRVIPQINTWVKRCSGYAYASSVNDDSINAIKGFGKDNYKYGYGKVRGALIKMWKKHGDKFDYYLKADDDSYVIMENLRLFLLNKDPNQDLYEGFKLHVTTDGKKPYSYHQGGAGYVMSKSVVKRLVETGFPKICQQNAAGFDDRVIGKCLTKLKVGIPDTRDMYNRLLFMPSTPNDFATKANNTKFNFFYDTNWNKFKKGSEGMSQYPLSFHYCDGNLMYAIEYLLYSANVIGIQQRIFHQSNNKIENKANVLKKMEQFSRVYYNKK
uniref:N-acetylgalactosaminide beta-1,3-galactosyltransferase n=1 Tax=Rhabditophanes sp. KR3021 TaxID=114890 RepID=A0AC35THN8_9BILA